MQKIEEIVKLKFGRQVTIRQDIKVWRKWMRHYNKLKAPIIASLALLPKEQALAWLNTPVEGHVMRGRTPKQMFHPRRINKLYRYWCSQACNRLTSTTTV